MIENECIIKKLDGNFHADFLFLINHTIYTLNI